MTRIVHELSGWDQGDAETATTTDCISRKQAIEALTGWETEPLDEDIIRTLGSLPPVTPTERTGEWLEVDNYYRLATCSHCRKVTMFEKWGEYTQPYNFCPNCGAKMRGDTESEGE